MVKLSHYFNVRIVPLKPLPPFSAPHPSASMVGFEQVFENSSPFKFGLNGVSLFLSLKAGNALNVSIREIDSFQQELFKNRPNHNALNRFYGEMRSLSVYPTALSSDQVLEYIKLLTFFPLQQVLEQFEDLINDVLKKLTPSSKANLVRQVVNFFEGSRDLDVSSIYYLLLIFDGMVILNVDQKTEISLLMQIQTMKCTKMLILEGPAKIEKSIFSKESMRSDCLYKFSNLEIKVGMSFPMSSKGFVFDSVKFLS